MQAHFRSHAYHRHSHETYSFGVTEAGAQSFTCRGEGRTSAAGMVMAFNPDDPHDGRATNRDGFTYRMIHISPTLVGDILAETTGLAGSMPLFGEPVIDDPLLARSLRDLHAALSHGTRSSGTSSSPRRSWRSYAGEAHARLVRQRESGSPRRRRPSLPARFAA
jgi:hypothetical protein